jgi:hypothetical protein
LGDPQTFGDGLHEDVVDSRIAHLVGQCCGIDNSGRTTALGQPGHKPYRPCRAR